MPIDCLKIRRIILKIVSCVEYADRNIRCKLQIFTILIENEITESMLVIVEIA